MEKIQKPTRKRRSRTSDHQLTLLQEAFLFETMPCSVYRDLLSKVLDLSSRSIQIWFQNRRQKMKSLSNQSQKAAFDIKRQNTIKVLKENSKRCLTKDDIAKLSDLMDVSAESLSLYLELKKIKSKLEFDSLDSSPHDSEAQLMAKRVNEQMYRNNSITESNFSIKSQNIAPFSSYSSPATPSAPDLEDKDTNLAFEKYFNIMDENTKDPTLTSLFTFENEHTAQQDTELACNDWFYPSLMAEYRMDDHYDRYQQLQGYYSSENNVIN